MFRPDLAQPTRVGADLPRLSPVRLLLVSPLLLGLGTLGITLFSPSERQEPPYGLAALAVFAVVGLWSAVAFVTRRAAWSIGSVVLLLVLESFVLATQAAGHPYPADPGTGRVFAGGMLIPIAAATGGLVARRLWARWVALGVALSGGLSSLFALPDAWTELDAWTLYVTLLSIGSWLVVLNLMTPEVRSSCRMGGSHADLWHASSSLVRNLRLAIVSAVMALPMLILYGVFESRAIPETSLPSLILAACVAFAVVLTIRQKTFGAVLLALSGVALIALTAMLSYSAAVVRSRADVAIFYGVFFSIAGALAIWAGASLTRPVSRFLRSR